MKTILGKEVSQHTRGILYLCEFNKGNLYVFREMFFVHAWEALEAYANIPNPPSQLVTAPTYEQLCERLDVLHKNMKDPVWLQNLGEQL